MKQQAAKQEDITHLVASAFAVAKACGYDEQNRWVVHVHYSGDVTIEHTEEDLVQFAHEVPVEF